MADNSKTLAAGAVRRRVKDHGIRAERPTPHLETQTMDLSRILVGTNKG